MSLIDDVRFIIKQGKEWVGIDMDGNRVTQSFECRYMLLLLLDAQQLEPNGKINGHTAYVPIYDMETLNGDKPLDNENEFDILVSESSDKDENAKQTIS
jgi:hypothetical protein